MRESEIIDVYSALSPTYDEKYLIGQLDTDIELEYLRKLLAGQQSWLDVGCGTGFFLRQFPHIPMRAGIDITPAMLDLAKDSGAELTMGNFLDPHPEWNGMFDLVTCMWFAYSHVDTVEEAAALVRNLLAWSRKFVFLPFLQITPDSLPVTYGGDMQIDAVVWSYFGDKFPYRNLVCPTLGFFRAIKECRVLDYPGSERRAILWEKQPHEP